MVKSGMTRKAYAIANEVECIVIAPDFYKEESTRFISKAIYLALGTPQIHAHFSSLGLAILILNSKGTFKLERLNNSCCILSFLKNYLITNKRQIQRMGSLDKSIFKRPFKQKVQKIEMQTMFVAQ